MIGRIRVPLPAVASAGEASRGWRILAVSDEREPALERAENRERLQPLDGILGCGDLEPAYMAMLADAFCVPLLYVRGNHDRGLGWAAGSPMIPEPLADARSHDLRGLELVGLSWPGDPGGRAERDERAAWRQVLRKGLLPRRSSSPCLVLSHMPPAGAGDDPFDAYHRGFRAYEWLARRLHPVLWLHGHTAIATRSTRVVEVASTTFVNVTGAALVELAPPETRPAGRATRE